MITIIQYNEQTRDLVEDLIEEFRIVRGRTENYSVLDNRLSNIETKLVGVLNECGKCKDYLNNCLSEIGKNLQLDVSKLVDFEIGATKEHAKIREDLNSKIDLLQTSFMTKLHEIDKCVTINTIKISGIAFVGLWLLKFILGKLLERFSIGSLLNL